jgi:hypothetical protein
MQAKPIEYSAIDGYQRLVECLGLHILNRFIELSGRQGTADDHRDVIGVLLQLPRYSTKGNHPEFALEVGIGDLVLATMCIGVVAEVRESAFGNKTCRVVPVGVDPGTAEESDWWPSVTLRPFASWEAILRHIRTMVPELPEALSDEQRVDLGLRFARAILKSRPSE